MFGVERVSDGLKLRFEVVGAVTDIKLPAAGRRERRDELEIHIFGLAVIA